MTTETPVEEKVDLSDLDMLDDDHSHGVCDRCYVQRPQLGQVVQSVCGRRVLFLYRGPLCDECVAIRDAGFCPVCGRIFADRRFRS